MQVKDMDLLDYFASQALATMPSTDYHNDEAAERIAECAYLVAEKMLKERERRKLI